MKKMKATCTRKPRDTTKTFVDNGYKVDESTPNTNLTRSYELLQRGELKRAESNEVCSRKSATPRVVKKNKEITGCFLGR